ERLLNHSGGIAKSVSDVVIGLQFDDIVRQKLEHVQEAVSEMQERFRALPNARARSTFLHENGRLQIAHLSGIEQQLSDAKKRIATNIQHIQDLLATIESEVISMRDIESA